MTNDYVDGHSGRGKCPIRRRASADHPCSVCGSGSKGCSESEDGLFLCRGSDRVPSGLAFLGPADGDPQFGLYRRADPAATPRREFRRSGAARPPDWPAQFAGWRLQLTPAVRQELADHLKVPAEVLDRLAVGYSPANRHGPALIGDPQPAPGGWVFAEVDAGGQIVGGLVRYRNGRKLSLPGGHRGLVLPAGWDQGDGPMFAIEGPSDVAAMIAAGLSAVGRPSDRAGATALARHMAVVPADRPLVIVGENDPKPDGSWPGRDGARAVAQAVATALPNPVYWALPPAGAKDVRDWLTMQTGPWPDRGTRLRDWLWTHRQPARPEPAVPTVPTYTPFPVEHLPEPLRSFVVQTAVAIGCDQAFVALPLLAVAASLVGTNRSIRLKRGWNEPSVIWAATVADSGSQKSPAFKAVMRPLYAVQKRLRAEFAVRMEQHERELAAWKELPEEDRGDKPQPPVLRRLFVSDITIERLTEILEDNPTGTLLGRDELAGWVGSFTRYKSKGAGSDVANWLEMHSAGPVTYDRKTGDRRTIFVEAAAVSVTGTIQPGIFRRAMTQELHDSGLCARLLLAMPTPRKKKWTELEVHPDTLAAYERVVDRLASLDGQVTLAMTAAAKALWVTFYNDWAQVQHDAEDALRPAFSKLEAYAPRLALVHHLVVQSTLPDPRADEPVGEASMAAGIALARWFADEARRVYAMAAEDEAQRERRLLVEKVRDRGGRMSARQLQRTNQKKYKTAPDAEADLEGLVRDGYGGWRDVPTTEAGGCPTREFVLRVTGDETDGTGRGPPALGDRGAAGAGGVTEPAPPVGEESGRESSVGSVTPSPDNARGQSKSPPTDLTATRSEDHAAEPGKIHEGEL